MKSLFSSESRITQFFGENPDYYSRFGLLGHEGLDLVPKGNDWTIFSPISGKVVRSYESGVYGHNVIIFNEHLGFSMRFAHLEFRSLKVDDEIIAGTAVGKMGESGQTLGAHLHLNLVPMNVWEERTYYNNGYKGRVDPIPFLHMTGRI